MEEQIDSSLKALIDPVCERTLEVARSVERASSIPQLVPVIFHDAATSSPLDCSEYFRSTVARFRAEGYSVVEFLSEDFSLFRKLGVWSSLVASQCPPPRRPRSRRCSLVIHIFVARSLRRHR